MSVDAWERVAGVAPKVFKVVPERGYTEGFEYRLEGETLLRFHKQSDQPIVHSDLLFKLSRSPLRAELAGLAIWMEGVRTEVQADRMTQRPSSDRDAKYPRFEYHWRREGDQGALALLRVDLPQNTFSTYWLTNPERVKGEGVHPMSARLPRSVEAFRRVDTLLGKQVPWKIDFAQKAAEIVEQSRVMEFMEEFKASMSIR